MIQLFKGDCLAVMDRLIEEVIIVDAIICDPPYQTTSCSWDTLIPFNKHIMVEKGKKFIPMYEDEYILQELKKGRDYNEICNYFNTYSKEGMWYKLNKLIKPNGAIVLFGSEPFSSLLRASNLKNFKYDWIWEKQKASNFMGAKHQPLKHHEIISVFNVKGYNPQKYNVIEISDVQQMSKAELVTYHKERQFDNFGVVDKRNTLNNPTSNKELIGSDITRIRNTDDGTRFPKSVIKINKEARNEHPTQKPVALMEYLIKTYTNENETVLDFTMGSGTTGVACKNLNRNFIGIEMDETYFNIAQKRINEI